MSKVKLLFAAAIAIVAFAAVASSASAYRAAVSRAGAISSVSLGKITFGSGPEVECNLTLNGTLASSVELTAGTSMGAINEVRWANCTGGTVGGVLGLPWNLSVDSIGGTLPNEATELYFDLRGSAFNLSVFFGIVNCLYAGDSSATLAVNDTGTNTYTSGLITADETIQLPFIRGSGACPEEGGFAGTFNLTSQTLTVS
jgi:hypothetical protein